MKKFAVVFLTAALVAPAQAQDQSKPARQDEKVSVGTVEVLLDVVVKDKRGRAVTGLSVAEFEVFEDGVKQPVESFRLITRNSAGESGKVASPVPDTASARAAATPGKPASTQNPDVGVSVVALVFDRLSQDARKRAHDAAMSYVGADSSLSNFIGVFAVNLSVNTVQNYTTDVGLVKKAIEKAGAMAPSSFESKTIDTGTALAAAQRDAAVQAAAAAAQSGGAGAAGAGAAAGAAAVEQAFEAMRARTEETFEALQRDQQGYATTNGLMAIVNSMSRLPGRKAVLFFSEGVSIPPNVQQQFRSVIHAANRANVSVYAVDAAGLRTDSTLKATREEINALYVP